MIISKEILDSVLVKAYEISETAGYSLVKTMAGWSSTYKTHTWENVVEIEECIIKTKAFLNEILNNDSHFSTVQDYSLVELGDLCYNLQLINDIQERNLSHSLCINISIMAPLFHIHLLELPRKPGNFAKWDGLPRRNIPLEKGQYSKVISDLTEFLRKGMGLFKFPENLLNTVIPGAFTEDIEVGTFTYYNAFFLRNYYTR